MVWNPTQRFSDRADTYARYRPSYPVEAIDILRESCALGPGADVADVGAGTGIFSSLLLETGASVTAIEPNDAMRSKADAWLGDNPRYASRSGTAENTGLPDDSCDLVGCAQAFHWFEREPSIKEFRRILRTGGWLALIWNSRSAKKTPFLEGYEAILVEHCPEYRLAKHRDLQEAHIGDVFHDGGNVARIPYLQPLDLDSLIGRSLSSSYAPAVGSPLYEPFVRDLTRLFEATAEGARVEMEYETELFWGHI
jgi:SAM-dependent methyltransferase